MTDFLAFCNATGTPYDFVSTHDYSSCSVTNLGDAQAIMSGMQNGRAILDSDTEWLVTEFGASCLQGFGSGYNPAAAYHDMVDQAAYTMAVVDRVADYPGRGSIEPQALSYWAFSDVFEESFFPLANESFHGMFGLINLHGIPKPTYRAYQLLHELGTTRVAVQGPSPPPLPACGPVETGVDYYGHDIGHASPNVTTPAECCHACGAVPGCLYYSFHIDSKQCGLKNGRNATADANRISGSIVPPANVDRCHQTTGVIAVINSTSSQLDVIVYNHATWNTSVLDCTVRVEAPTGSVDFGAKSSTLRRIDGAHTNPLATWVAMGAPDYTTAAQNKAIMASSVMETQALSSAQGVTIVGPSALDIVVPAQGTAVIRANLISN
eukprot:m.457188 g.457188  ORF g.457188 m.457188 type:complete len:380 (+) comp20331_c0_seq5:325-1464(+)